ncbi:germination protein YpeB [Paenibacillus crassostreae]|uniref:Germination protein YpeB n=1 Tax=Paenibacillus crassostreae TaxID=1763538 RepID=A0A167DJH4_9BACL|nr:germination protein YpeB [Paenibacillus crassostreae]AOZ91391.1 germination protein YpeB [Paenibacillus crassostreae]OAB74450.1 germination protein YpeB [Paenibacillus crassostreae]
MYKRLSAVLFPVMTVLLIGAMVWGYQENQEKNSILIKAENQYQRAFHDLSYHVDRLHGEIGNTLAVNSASRSMHRKGLVNVWRMTSEAQNEINQLPLALLPFNKTEEFLSKISKFSYQTSIRDLDKEPLSEQEFNTLKVLYKNSAQISKELQAVQDKVIKNRIRWMDVEATIANEDQMEDNSVIDGFKLVDKTVGEYPDLDWGPSVASINDKRSVKKLDGVPVTEEDIRRKSIKFADLGSNVEVQITENGKGTEWASYTAQTKSSKGKAATISMDFTKKGGLLISYSDNRKVGNKKVDMEQARDKVNKFLVNKGYHEMTPIMYDEYGNMGTFTYVRKQDGVLIYPEKMTVRVGLDNGEVTGFQASEFVYEQQNNRKIPPAKLNLEEARKMLNQEFTENYNRKSLIEDEYSKEVLCYEFGGKVNGTNYRVFINAEDGSEVSVEEIRTPVK